MKIKYDQENDVLYLEFSEEAVSESYEDKPGIIIDYSDKGNIIGIEILEASKNMNYPNKFEYEVA